MYPHYKICLIQGSSPVYWIMTQDFTMAKILKTIPLIIDKLSHDESSSEESKERLFWLQLWLLLWVLTGYEELCEFSKGSSVQYFLDALCKGPFFFLFLNNFGTCLCSSSSSSEVVSNEWKSGELSPVTVSMELSSGFWQPNMRQSLHNDGAITIKSLHQFFKQNFIYK